MPSPGVQSCAATGECRRVCFHSFCNHSLAWFCSSCCWALRTAHAPAWPWRTRLSIERAALLSSAQEECCFVAWELLQNPVLGCFVCSHEQKMSRRNMSRLSLRFLQGYRNVCTWTPSISCARSLSLRASDTLSTILRIASGRP